MAYPFKIPFNGVGQELGFIALEIVTTPISGAVNITQTAQTSSATATVIIKSVVANTQPGQIISSATQSVLSGSFNQSHSAQEVTAAGAVRIYSSLSKAQDAQSLAASAGQNTAITGSFLVTQGAQTLTATVDDSFFEWQRIYEFSAVYDFQKQILITLQDQSL